MYAKIARTRALKRTAAFVWHYAPPLYTTLPYDFVPNHTPSYGWLHVLGSTPRHSAVRYLPRKYAIILVHSTTLLYAPCEGRRASEEG